MSQAKQYNTSRALVIGAQGVLGGLLARAFETGGWAVVAGRAQARSRRRAPPRRP